MFLTDHPQRPVIYVTDLEKPGTVYAVRTEGEQPTILAQCPSGGNGPCHLSVHPRGGWLYVAHYSDGSVTALKLNDDGGLTDELVRLTFEGSSVDPDRQEASHAHATSVTPSGGFLLVTDLGADVLRAYSLIDGRPAGAPILTRLPPNCGPRHMAWQGDTLYITGELSGDVVVVTWDESAGRGEVMASVPIVTQSVSEKFYLSDLVVHDDHVVVAARGRDTLSVLRPDKDAGLVLIREVPTSAWPNGLAVASDTLLVAATRDHHIAAHSIGANGHLSEVRRFADIRFPMAVLIG